MTFKILVETCGLFMLLFVAGLVGCLPLYRWRLSDFFASRLWVKLYFWIPIFAVFCLVITVGRWAALLVVTLLLIQAGRELIHFAGWRRIAVAVYVILFTFSLLHVPLFFLGSFHGQAGLALVTICFGSVLSDVCAFFGGTYLGKHQLPAFINERKSYEGVTGQLVGSWLGVAMISILPGIDFSWGLGLVIGLASAVGDLSNSVAKRQLGIKDWGTAIPGHGGVLDRFSSLSFALAAGYWFFS